MTLYVQKGLLEAQECPECKETPDQVAYEAAQLRFQCESGHEWSVTLETDDD